MSISERPIIGKESSIVSEVTLGKVISKDVDNFSPVTCGEAIPQEEKMQRLRLVTIEYIRRNYVSKEGEKVAKQGGVYIDEYENSAYPFVAKIGSDVVASLRLIPNKGLGMPINNEEEIQEVVYPQWKGIIKNTQYEWSQLAKSKELFRDSRPVMGLIRTAFVFSRENGCNEGTAVMDDNVRKLMNGPLMKFNLLQIGESIHYMGSQSTPIYFNIDKVIKSSYDGGLHELSSFLDTGKAEGFEWYKGK